MKVEFGGVNKITFKDVMPGDVFVAHNDQIYIRDNEGGVVRVSDGAVFQFEPDELVELKPNARLLVDG